MSCRPRRDLPRLSLPHQRRRASRTVPTTCGDLRNHAEPSLTCHTLFSHIAAQGCQGSPAKPSRSSSELVLTCHTGPATVAQASHNLSNRTSHASLDIACTA